MTKFVKLLTALELLGVVLVLFLMAVCLAPGAFL